MNKQYYQMPDKRSLQVQAEAITTQVCYLPGRSYGNLSQSRTNLKFALCHSPTGYTNER
jgi:hypothetical protein